MNIIRDLYVQTRKRLPAVNYAKPITELFKPDDTLKQMFFHSNSKKYGTCLKNKRAFNNWRRSAVFVDANLKLFNL